MSLRAIRARVGRAAIKAGWAKRRGAPQVSQARLSAFLAAVRRRPLPILPAPPATLALVMPCFGHAAYVGETLRSIVAQTRAPDEVVMIDDYSTDGTTDILEAFVGAHRSPGSPAWRLLRNDRNLGQAASLNRGISAARSDLVMVVNDDDYLMHDAVAVALALMRDHPGLALIGAGNVTIAGEDALAEIGKMSGDHNPGEWELTVHNPEAVPTYRHPNDINMTHTGSCFYKVVWSAVGGYWPDKRRRVVPYSDRDFQIRVNALWPVGVAYDKALSFWRSDSSVDAGRNS